jgi:hypothetical protein
MKRVIVFFFLTIVALALSAQEKNPKLEFLSTSHNFGEILEDAGIVSYGFQLSNSGAVPLIITRVATSCGCTASDWTKEPIMPGGKGVVTISYNPKGRPGAINQRVTVFSNAPGGGTVLSLRGQVIPREKTKEEIFRRKIGDLGLTNSHLSFGVINPNQVKTDTLKMYNFGNEPISITYDGLPKHITVKVEPASLDPGKEGNLIFTFNASGINEWGYMVDRARIQVNKKNLQGNTVNVSARIEEDFSKLTARELEMAPQIEFSEIQKDFGNVKEGDVIDHEFVFTNTGKSDLVIRKIQASCGCTTVAPKVTVIKPGEQSSLAASFRTRGFTGRQSKTITVITNDPKRSNIVLRLSGTVEKE